MNTQPVIKQLCIIGVGLIGGSLARALRRAGAVQHIVGIGRSRENLERAVELGVIDEMSHDIAQGVRAADRVIVAVPMGMYEQVFQDMAGNLQDDAIISDVGSTKMQALNVAKQCLADASRFVPAHPIAGTEKSGAAASFAELFDNRTCILTPDATTDLQAVQRIEQMWQTAGSKVIQMDANTHDQLLAGVSHLPHLAAFALVNAVRKQRSDNFDPFAFAAGGFRDFTRIASSSPEMWRDIAMSNRQPLLQQITALKNELSRLEKALQQRDKQTLLDEFSAAKNARGQWLKKHGDDF
ncbi:MAG: prephenate dehydrogenase/arogenate dehydrogenase family protein [Mariprofundaceae bacterium]|nr:prephenate dehydrogenase/arogenate dehydrogenase family protein [Mariprofundaceae bacterium]